MGGLWEAGIKSVKYHLKRALGRSRLTYEEFETVIIQVEGILNSRPLFLHQYPMILITLRTATAGSDGVQSGRPIFDDFFQHLWPYIGNNTANVVFQMVKRLWLIRIDQ
ncbi:hypothetical protein TNCV_220551 [Trichonephila clavipes]|nr:hypothetical protein TNCV_220551 [Trichonephila clavipes]